ncbi:MAG: GNAT family N-acetyltransferase [Luteolibacter sp.]|uniref:GNAT family N-acetyltransferase n=1 Tax=Luteolibacter sp. TaxID=1962973 RepID=UPI0032666FA9
MFSHAVTPQIKLSLLEERHAEALFHVTDQNRAYLRVWLPWLDSTRTAEDTRAFIRGTRDDFATRGWAVCGIWFEGEICGVIGYNQIDWTNKVAYIGYWLAENFQGKGIITACCRSLIDHSFRDLDLNKVVITCGTGNSRSQAVPDRLGFVREGVLRDAEWLYDHFIDHTVNAVLKREWGKAE